MGPENLTLPCTKGAWPIVFVLRRVGGHFGCLISKSYVICLWSLSSSKMLICQNFQEPVVRDSFLTFATANSYFDHYSLHEKFKKMAFAIPCPFPTSGTTSSKTRRVALNNICDIFVHYCVITRHWNLILENFTVIYLKEWWSIACPYFARVMHHQNSKIRGWNGKRNRAVHRKKNNDGYRWIPMNTDEYRWIPMNTDEYRWIPMFYWTLLIRRYYGICAS